MEAERSAWGVLEPDDVVMRGVYGELELTCGGGVGSLAVFLVKLGLRVDVSGVLTFGFGGLLFDTPLDEKLGLEVGTRSAIPHAPAAIAGSNSAAATSVLTASGASSTPGSANAATASIGAGSVGAGGASTRTALSPSTSIPSASPAAASATAQASPAVVENGSARVSASSADARSARVVVVDGAIRTDGGWESARYGAWGGVGRIVGGVPNIACASLAT